MIVIAITGISNISYAAQTGNPYQIKIESLGIKIPDELSSLPNSEDIFKILYEEAENQKFVVYNYKIMADLYSDMLLKIQPLKQSHLNEFVTYTLLDSTKYGSWSDSFLSYNCYGYALSNLQWLTPGQLSGGTFSLSMPISDMAQLVINDLRNSLNGEWSIYKTTSKPSLIPSGGKVICIRKGVRDFHLMKAVSNTSTWRHKPGNTNILTWKYSSPNYKVWTNELIFKDTTNAPTLTYDSLIYYIIAEPLNISFNEGFGR